MKPFDGRRGKTKNLWCSIDTHVKDTITVIGYATTVHKMHMVIIDRQYIVSMYNHLVPNTLRPLSFLVTTSHIICVLNDIGPSRLSTFGRQFTPNRSLLWCLKYIAWLSSRSVSSSFSSMSMTYHEQFSKSPPCTASLSRLFTQSDAWINEAGWLSFIRVPVAHWPLLFQVVWHYGLKFC